MTRASAKSGNDSPNRRRSSIPTLAWTAPALPISLRRRNSFREIPSRLAGRDPWVAHQLLGPRSVLRPTVTQPRRDVGHEVLEVGEPAEVLDDDPVIHVHVLVDEHLSKAHRSREASPDFAVHDTVTTRSTRTRPRSTRERTNLPRRRCGVPHVHSPRWTPRSHTSQRRARSRLREVLRLPAPPTVSARRSHPGCRRGGA